MLDLECIVISQGFVVHWHHGIYRVDQENGLFFTVDNFVTVSDRKACCMSKVSQFVQKISKTFVPLS